MSDSPETEKSSQSESRGGLSPLAYEAVPGDEYPPYVSASEEPAELTPKAIIVGIMVGMVFGAANAYLGLRVGLTVSASIPAAVLGVAVFQFMRGGTILETNMVQTIGSAGESLAAGVIFTLAGLYIWELDPSYITIFTIAVLGGFLGILFMIPLRTFLIVGEHDKLPYPEGKACAEVLVAGEQEASKVKSLFAGLGVGALYQSLMHGNLFNFWGDEPAANIPGYDGAQVGMTVSPELLGVGYIIGPRIAAVMMSGGVIGWLVFIPLIHMIGSGLGAPLYPATEMTIAQMDPHAIWSNYVRYIGAGAVAVGGFLTLIKSIPVIWSSFKKGIEGLRAVDDDEAEREEPRTDRDLPPSVFLTVLALIIVTIAVLPSSIMPAGVVTAALIALFAFFFVTVSSRIVGLIGSSSNPVSGMTIATLLVTALIFVWLGWADVENARFAVLAVGAVVCIAAAIAGDTSQDLKTGFLVGATPQRQQIGEFIGVATSALVMGFVLNLLHQAYGIGSEQLAAPQATIMTLVIDGVLEANLPWNLVFVGGALAGIVELLGLPSLALAVGLYLPLSLSTPIMVGGMIRGALEYRYDGGEDEDGGEDPGREASDELRSRRERGVLYSSGLIAGAALVGVVAAGFIALSQLEAAGSAFVRQVGNAAGSVLDGMQAAGEAFQATMSPVVGSIFSVLMFAILASTLAYTCFRAGADE